MGEVLTVLPYQNTVATFRMPGKALVAALEHGLSGIEEGAGRFPQVAGLRWSTTPPHPPETDACTVWRWWRTAGAVRWTPSGSTRSPRTTICATAATAMPCSSRTFGTPTISGPNLEDVVADYLARHAPYAPLTDGRVSLLQAGTDSPNLAGRCAALRKGLPALLVCPEERSRFAVRAYGMKSAPVTASGRDRIGSGDTRDDHLDQHHEGCGEERGPLRPTIRSWRRPASAYSSVNLGTPTAPISPPCAAISRIPVGSPRHRVAARVWYPILYGIVLNTRPKKSGAAYARSGTRSATVSSSHLHPGAGRQARGEPSRP